MQEFKFALNGAACTVHAEPTWTLMYVLREVLDLTGTKCGCSTGDCGACKVIVDGKAVNSCLLQMRRVEGCDITTVEGVANGPALHPIQQAFVEAGAVQCGYCIPGMVISAKALLDENPSPTEAEIRAALRNNLCRCTGYVKIVQAVQNAATLLRQGKEAV